MNRAEYNVARKRQGLEDAVRREQAHVVSARENVKAHARHLAAAREALAAFDRAAEGRTER